MSIILPTQNLPDLSPITPAAVSPSRQSGFSEALAKVNQVLNNADAAAAGYAEGRVGLTEAVLASEKADTTFEVLIAVRNRALSAYQDIMNMQF